MILVPTLALIFQSLTNKKKGWFVDVILKTGISNVLHSGSQQIMSERLFKSFEQM